MSEITNDIGSRISESTLLKLQTLSQALPEGNEEIAQLDIPVKVPVLLSQVEEFLGQDKKNSEIIPNLDYLTDVKGLANRISAVATEHFGDTLPVLHFTNAAIGDDVDVLTSSGFLEKFMKNGSVGKTHVGAFLTQDEQGGSFRDMNLEQDGPLDVLDKARTIAKEFHRHGMRTNKNQLGDKRDSEYSLPAVILFPKPANLVRGTDRYDHWIIKDSIKPEQIMTIVHLDPARAIVDLMRNKGEQNIFLKKIIYGLGKYRLEQLKSALEQAPDTFTKQNIALYAHDLVDAYLIRRDDYDSTFDISILNNLQKIEIEKRRTKFNLLKDFKKEDQNAA